MSRNRPITSTPTGASMDGRMIAQAKAGTIGKIGSGKERPNTRTGRVKSTLRTRHWTRGTPIHRHGAKGRAPAI